MFRFRILGVACTQFSIITYIPVQQLQLLHADLRGPFGYRSIDGSKYFLSIVDGFSRFVHVKTLTNKSDVSKTVIDFIRAAETRFQSTGRVYKVGMLRTDNGGEFFNYELKEFMREKGIQHQLTVPHHSYQNGVAERMHRTLQMKTRTLLADAHMPIKFWPEAVITAAYLVNRTPTHAINDEIPYTKWYDERPGLHHLRVFGCICYAVIPQGVRDGKLGPTTRKCVMLGYDPDHKAYRVFDTERRMVVVSSQVKFDEYKMYYQTKNVSQTTWEYVTSANSAGGIQFAPIRSDSTLVIGSKTDKMQNEPRNDDDDEEDDDDETIEDPATASSKDISDGEIQSTELENVDEIFDEFSLENSKMTPSRYKRTRNSTPIPRTNDKYLGNHNLSPSLSSERENTMEHHLRNRRMDISRIVEDNSSMSVVLDEKRDNDLDDGSDGESKLVDQQMAKLNVVNYVASSSIAPENEKMITEDVPKTLKQAMNSKDASRWKEAINEELRAHAENQTFSLVRLPKRRKAITCRWVFTIKKDGRFKARLVARGFSQVKGIDYEETFPPVIRYESLRIMMAIAAQKKMVFTSDGCNHCFP